MLDRLFCVVVNWNLREDTLECVRSVLAAGIAPERVVVVDNGSSDGSVAALHERFGPGLPVLEAGSNLGFAGGSNLGIRFALEQGARRVFLLNNDTIVAPHLFGELERADASGRFGIVAPLILDYYRPDRISYLGDRRLAATLITRSLARGQQAHLLRLPPLAEVDFVSGCAMLVRRAVLEQVGLLDTTFFMYGEDVDFCHRARAAGVRLAVATRARIWHKVSASSHGDTSGRRYLRVRNQIRFYRLSAEARQLPLLVAFTLARAMRLAAADLVHGQAKLLEPTARGWRDGWFTPARGKAP